MKALVYNRKCQPDKLVYSDVPKPIPKEDQVLIRIHAASVNAADYRSIKMGLIPKKKIFGSDIAGKVEEVGQLIQRFKIGDEVIGDLSGNGLGGFAEYVVAPEKVLVSKPEKIPFEQAAALPMAAVTALQALRNKGNIQKGQKVLIVGSSGGVGTFAVQLAKNFGSVVTGVCSTKNVGQTKSLGADQVVDYTKEDFTKIDDTYDLILAVHGNRPLSTYKKILNPNGIFVVIGGGLSQLFSSLIFGRLMFLGSKKICTLMAKPNQADLEFIAKLVANGKIRPVIDRSYTLEEASEAMQYVGERHARGKVVVNVVPR